MSDNDYYQHTDTLANRQQLQTILNIGKQINGFMIPYLSIPLVVLNFLGNVINLYIFTRLRFKKVSVGFYLACLSVGDIIGSFTIIYYYIIFQDYGMQDLPNMTLKILIYVYSTVSFYSPWFSVLVALDRVISIFSIKLSQKISKKRFKITLVATMSIFLSLVNLALLIEDYNFMIASESSYYYSYIFPYLDIVLTTTLPFTLMCIANIVSVVYLKKSKARSKAKSGANRENRFIIIAISLNILFLITYLPHSIMQFWGQYRYTVNTMQTLEEFYRINIGNEYYCIASYWKLLYSLLHVIIYYAGNQIFREELKRKLKLIAKFRKNRF